MKNVTYCEHAGAVLVFGLTWEPVIGSNGRAQALRASRRARSSHMVFSSAVMASVGHASLETKRRKGMNMYSAAQCVASMHTGGSVLLLARIEGQGIWMLACHEGTVVSRTDCFCDNLDQVERIVEELRQIYSQLQIIDALANPENFSLEMLLEQAGKNSQLELITSVRNLFAGYGHWLFYLFIASGVAYWVFPSRSENTLSVHMQSLDAHAIWSEATDQVLGQKQSGVVGAKALLQTLYQVPANIKGWSLLHVICQAQGARWDCQSAYTRGHKGVDNETFFRSMPAAWQVQVVALDQIRVRWHIEHLDAPLKLAVLQSRDATNRGLVSALQRIEPAFERISLGQAEALQVVPSLQDSATVVARPLSIPGVARRSLELSGPLRSVALLQAHAHSISWNRIELAYRPETVVGLRESRMHIVLTGDIHETV